MKGDFIGDVLTDWRIWVFLICVVIIAGSFFTLSKSVFTGQAVKTIESMETGFYVTVFLIGVTFIAIVIIALVYAVAK